MYSWLPSLMPQIETEWLTAHTQQALTGQVSIQTCAEQNGETYTTATSKNPTPKKKFNRNNIIVGSHDTRCVTVIEYRSGQDSHTAALAGGSEEHEFATTKSISSVNIQRHCMAMEDEPINGPYRHQR